MTATLITRAGELVTTYEVPPFQLTPEVALWGSRFFVLDRPFEQKPGEPSEPIYREACAWSVDVSKALTSLGVQVPEPASIPAQTIEQKERSPEEI